MNSFASKRTKYLLLIASSGLAIVQSLPVAAQDQIANASDEADKPDDNVIVVTGSHIKRSGFEGRAPIQVLNREDIAEQGAGTIVDIAKDLTVNTGSFITQETGGLIGTAQFNVRGLGTGSTLTLINGRRAGKSATADGSGNQFFDINQLPLMVIDRIDVQTDGASATYGSEAVGGVVNIITRKGFDGLELMGRYENSSNSAYSINGALGLSDDRGSFAVYGTYYKQTRNSRTDFDWLTDRIAVENRFFSSNGAPGNYQLAILDPVTGAFQSRTGSEVPDPDCLAAGGVNIAGSSRCRANFVDQVSIIPEESRIQVFAEGDYEISDNVRVYAEASFSHNEINRTQGTSLYDRGLAGGRMLVPADHPFNFWVSDGGNGIMYVDPSQWDNNVNTAVPVAIRGRPFGVEEFYGDSPFNQDLEFRLNYLRALGGATIGIGSSWELDLSYVYNKSEWRQSTPFKYVSANLNAALQDGSYNPFGTRIVNPTLVSPKDGTSVAGLTEGVFNNITYTEINRAEATQQVVDAVFSGDLMDIGDNIVGAAVGVQYRNETYEFRQDALSQAGLGGRINEAVADIDGTQDVYAGFVEVLVPLSDGFELSGALRHEDFGGGIGSTTDPKISARWEPTDFLAVRGTFGTAFQAPSVRQTGESVSTSFVNDPFTVDAGGNLVCGVGTRQANTVIRTGGDRNLSPQSATNWNAGVVLTPSSGLRVSVDYWRFNYKNLIRPDANPQSIVDQDCADDGMANDPRVTRGASGQLSGIDVAFINTGRVVTDGIDANLAYDFGNIGIGELNFDATASYVKSFRISDASGTTVQGAGSRNFSNPFSSVPRWRVNSTLGFASGDHGVSVTGRYISSYTNDQLTDGSKVGSWFTMDARYAFNLENLIGTPVTFSVGVNNMFDRDPPSLGTDIRPGYDANVHDVRGRLFYTEVSVKL